MSAAEIIQFAEMPRGRPLKAPLTEFSEASFVEWFGAAISGSSEAGMDTEILEFHSLRNFSLATKQIESQGARKIFPENNS